MPLKRVDAVNFVRAESDRHFDDLVTRAGGVNRYQTAMVVDEDHYIDHVFDRPGEHTLEASMFPTSHVALAVRILVDPADPADLAEVHALRDRLRIEAGSATAPAHPSWDTDSLDATRALLMKLAEGLTAFDGAFGSRSQTDPILQLLGTAAGWGGLPPTQATYIGVSPNVPVGHHVLKVPAQVPVRGFWSVSVYNSDG